jgi:phage terminase small subunit
MPRTVKKDANLKPGKPEKPVNLSPRAAVAWDRLVSQLEGAQIQLTTAHSSLLSIASTLSADIADAWETVKVKGAYITNAKTGAVQEHPASKKLDALRRDLIKVLTCLSVRAVPAPPPNNGPSLEDILSGKAEAEG